MKTNYSRIKTVFLCGGMGKRMFPLTEDKVLLDFLGKPLLQHQLEMARKAGLNQFVIIGNPGNIEKIKEITKRISGSQIEIVTQKKPLGIADALKSAEPFLQGQILVINPNDIFSSLAYTKIIEAAGGDSSSCMLGYQVKEYFPGGYLVTDSHGILQRIVEKPTPGEEPSAMVNILVHLHNNPEKLLECIETVQTQTTRDDVYECALDNMTQGEHKIKVLPYNDFWAAIKYPWHIFKVMEYFLDMASPSISSSASISDKAIIKGKVILGDNVRVMENAVIQGPVYVGPNSVIGTSALIREYSHIGANSVIGFSTEVKHSYIGNNCWFHSNYIGDSVIDDNCSFGAGTILSNFRLDEGNIHVKVGNDKIDTGYDKFGAIMGQGCRTGVNANVMPGIRVGANSSIGPNVCLNHDLENNKVILLKQEYEIKERNTKLPEDKKQELLKRLRQ